MSTRFGSGKVQIIASDRKIVEMVVSRIFGYASLWYNGIILCSEIKISKNGAGICSQGRTFGFRVVGYADADIVINSLLARVQIELERKQINLKEHTLVQNEFVLDFSYFIYSIDRKKIKSKVVRVHHSANMALNETPNDVIAISELPWSEQNLALACDDREFARMIFCDERI